MTNMERITSIFDSEQEYQNFPLALFTIDEKGNLTRINGAFVGMTGYTKNDIRDIGMNGMLFDGDPFFEGETYLETKGHGIRRVRIKYIHKDEGSATGILDDITEKKIIERTPLPTAYFDLDGNLRLWNANLEALTGYSRREAEEYECISKERVKDLIRRTLRMDGIKNEGFDLKTKQGEPREVMLSTMLIKDSSEKSAGVVFSMMDITKDRRVSQALEGYSRRVISSKNIEIKYMRDMEQKLRDYANQLERSNELKDLFTDIISHDLNNPITVIYGCSSLLLDRKNEMEEDMKNDIEVIKGQAARLTTMIENAKTYAKIESLDELESLEILDINVIFKRIMEDLGYLFDDEVTIDYRAEGKCPALTSPIISDVFINLLTNAIKYGSDGGRIVVDIEDVGENWRVMVKDYGDGIHDRDKKDIFERFKRRDKKGVKGTGLGLAIVKRIVDLHRGKVWVEDNPEGGSIFYVSLRKAPG
jgi:PAS domain S-box-containing protein